MKLALQVGSVAHDDSDCGHDVRKTRETLTTVYQMNVLNMQHV